MPNDHKKKKLTHLEEIQQNMNGLMQAIQDQYRIFGDFDRRLTALARAKLDPETFAKFMLDGEANKEYMTKLNQNIDLELEKMRAAEEQKNTTA